MSTTESGGRLRAVLDSAVTSGLSPEELLSRLESYGIEWYLTEQGDLMIKYWQVGAEGFVSPERVGTIRIGKTRPKDASALEWVSGHLSELTQVYAGRWVAIVGAAVAASAPTLPQLLEQIQELGIEHPFVTEIPLGQITWHTTYARSFV